MRRLGFVLLGLAACDPRDFTKLQDQTWVDVTGAPSSLSAQDFGAAIGFGGSSPDSATVLVAARVPASVGLLAYSSTGKLSTDSIEGKDSLASVTSLGVAPAMAGDPGAFGLAGGSVALGASDGTSGFALLYRPDDLHTTVPPVNLTPMTEAPSGLGFGPTSASGATDLVAAGGTVLAIRPDYQNATTLVASCTLDDGAGGAVTAAGLVVGELAGSIGQREIAVGLAAATGGGQVLITSGDSVVTGGTCAATLRITAPGNEPDFGAHLAIGSFDGNATDDLVVSAPAEHAVYVYLDVINGGTLTPITVAAPAGAASFGDALAAGDFDGDGQDELVVGDSTADAGGKTAAGLAHVFSLSGTAFTLQSSLADSSPDTKEHFGRALAVAPLGSGQILVVGAVEHVFTYFRVLVAGTDVRG